MRAFDGSLFDVDWVIVPETNKVLELLTPFRSGRDDPQAPFDTGIIGEIPSHNPPFPTVKLPSRVCHDCREGRDEYWENGWPTGTPPVTILPDGFASGCTGGLVFVSSVGLALPPTEFIVTGSPVTDVGVLTGDWLPQPANLVLASPDGATGVPHFRRLTAADLPTGTGNTFIATVGWQLDPWGALSGLPTIGAFTLVDGETGVVFSAPTSPVDNGPWVVHPGPWTRPSWYATGTTFTGPIIVNILQGSADTGAAFDPALFWGAPYTPGTAFTPWTVGTDPTSWAPVGTGNYQLVAGSNVVVTPVFPVPTNDASSILVELSTDPFFNSVQLITAVTPPTNNTLYTDSATHTLHFIDDLFVDREVAVVGGAGSLVVSKFTLNFAALTSPTVGLQRIPTVPIPANASLVQILWTVPTAWTKTGGTPLDIATVDFGFASNDGYHNSIAGTSLQFPTALIGNTFSANTNNYGGGSHDRAGYTEQLAFHMTPGETPTAGDFIVWYVYVVLP